jgi:hypothetical protein
MTVSVSHRADSVYECGQSSDNPVAFFVSQLSGCKRTIALFRALLFSRSGPIQSA